MKGGERSNHSAVWTGREMIIWGGCQFGPWTCTPGQLVLGDGFAFDPAMNTWRPLSTTRAPRARELHDAIWTGRAMLIIGGYDHADGLNGATYDPIDDTWTPLELDATAFDGMWPRRIWTGRELIIWGGYGQDTLPWGDASKIGQGVRYNVASSVLVALPLQGAARPRVEHGAVWTGREMIVWGGEKNRSRPIRYPEEDPPRPVLRDGARYRPPD